MDKEGKPLVSRRRAAGSALLLLPDFAQVRTLDFRTPRRVPWAPAPCVAPLEEVARGAHAVVEIAARRPALTAVRAVTDPPPGGPRWDAAPVTVERLTPRAGPAPLDESPVESRVIPPRVAAWVDRRKSRRPRRGAPSPYAVKLQRLDLPSPVRAAAAQPLHVVMPLSQSRWSGSLPAQPERRTAFDTGLTFPTSQTTPAPEFAPSGPELIATRHRLPRPLTGAVRAAPILSDQKRAPGVPVADRRKRRWLPASREPVVMPAPPLPPAPELVRETAVRATPQRPARLYPRNVIEPPPQLAASPSPPSTRVRSYPAAPWRGRIDLIRTMPSRPDRGRLLDFPAHWEIDRFRPPETVYVRPPEMPD